MRRRNSKLIKFFFQLAREKHIRPRNATREIRLRSLCVCVPRLAQYHVLLFLPAPLFVRRRVFSLSRASLVCSRKRRRGQKERTRKWRREGWYYAERARKRSGGEKCEKTMKINRREENQSGVMTGGRGPEGKKRHGNGKLNYFYEATVWRYSVQSLGFICFSLGNNRKVFIQGDRMVLKIIILLKKKKYCRINSIKKILLIDGRRKCRKSKQRIVKRHAHLHSSFEIYTRGYCFRIVYQRIVKEADGCFPYGHWQVVLRLFAL